jgi:hypothetical protein
MENMVGVLKMIVAVPVGVMVGVRDGVSVSLKVGVGVVYMAVLVDAAA